MYWDFESQIDHFDFGLRLRDLDKKKLWFYSQLDALHLGVSAGRQSM